MHCVGCEYDLVGLPPGPCPECSRPFDPEDPTTWVVRPVPAWRRCVNSRWTVYVLVSAVVLLAMYTTVLPRPFIAWDGKMNLGLWFWFDRPFGIERRRAAPERLDLFWWNGTLKRARHSRVIDTGGENLGYGVAWDLNRSGDQWRLHVEQSDVSVGTLLLAFNSMRDDEELFGVRLVGDMSIRNEEPFRARGTQSDILASVLVAYGLDIASSLIDADDTDLWVFDREGGTLERISVEEAVARGIEYDVLDGMRVSRFRYQP